MSKKNKNICSECFKELRTPVGLAIHKSRLNHYPKPPAPPIPEKVHVSYLELVRDSRWGRNMTKEERKHPQREELQLGALFRIIELLEELNEYLGVK